MSTIEKCSVTYCHDAERTTEGIFIGGIPLSSVISEVDMNKFEDEIKQMLAACENRLSMNSLLVAYLEGAKTANSRTLKEEIGFVFALSCSYMSSVKGYTLARSIHSAVKAASEEGLNITQTIESMVQEYHETIFDEENLPTPVITLLVTGLVTTLIAKMKSDPVFMLAMLLDL